MRNFYKVLGIAATADDRRIKSAFRRRAKAVHPDLNPYNDLAEARFIELVQAYEVLSDAETRAAYDAYLAERRSEARRRFAHCAGLMVTSFLMTAGTALLTLGLTGVHIPLRQGWEVATAAPSPPRATTATATAGPGGTGWTVRVATAAGPATAVEEDSAASQSWTAGTQTRRLRPEAPAPQRVAAAPARRPKTPVASGARTEPASPSLWSWLTAPPPERRYSLGASDVRP